MRAASPSVLHRPFRLRIGGICWPICARPSNAGLPVHMAGFGGCRRFPTRAAWWRAGAPGRSRVAPRTHTSVWTAGCVALASERGARRPSRTTLDRHLVHLQARVAEGCEDAAVLWRELQAQGFTGTAR